MAETVSENQAAAWESSRGREAVVRGKTAPRSHERGYSRANIVRTERSKNSPRMEYDRLNRLNPVPFGSEFREPLKTSATAPSRSRSRKTSGWCRNGRGGPCGSLCPERQSFVAPLRSLAFAPSGCLAGRLSRCARLSGSPLPSFVASRPAAHGLARGTRRFLEVPFGFLSIAFPRRNSKRGIYRLPVPWNLAGQ